MDQQDAFWVERARRGDRSAFGLLVEKHSPALLRVIARRCGADDAPDLAQEAWIRALLNLDRLREPARFGAWLKGIGANVARMWLRDRQPPGTSWEALEEEGHAAGNGVAPDEHVVLREMQQEVLSALDALSTYNRAAARLHYLHDRSYREIAERLGIPEKTVKSRLHKARLQLRKRLRHVVELPAEHARGKTMIDAHVFEVYLVERAPSSTGPSSSTIVVLKARDQERYLRIWVGGWEAQGIARMLRGAPTPRPMTHDLIVQLLSRLGHSVASIDISALRDNTYFATLRVANGDAVEELDCRPSDALAVAVGLGAPIRIAPEVLEQAGSDEWDSQIRPGASADAAPEQLPAPPQSEQQIRWPGEAMGVVSVRKLELEDVMQPRTPEPGQGSEAERKPL